MSLVINTNEQATRIHGTYNRNNTMMNAAMTRVATAQKINSARDGAANWAISEKMRERIRANDQANQNVQNDTALLKTAQGGIDNTIDILKTLKERALNSANDSNIAVDRSAIATEVYQLLEQINDNAAKVKFNGRTLLNGDYDNGAEDMFPVASATKTEEVPETITAPTAAENPSAKATNAVYGLLAGGTVANSDAKLTDMSSGTAADIAATTKLIDLADANGNKLFKEGDIIKFTWNEDGEAKQKSEKSVEVTDTLTLGAKSTPDGNSLAEKISSAGALKLSFFADDVPLTDADSNPVETTGGTAIKADGGDGTGSKTGVGLYAIGDKNVQITDLAVSVTYKDTANNNVETTRAAAQEALAFTGLRQAEEPTTGSHTVFGYGSLVESGTTTSVTESTAPTSVSDGTNTLVQSGKSLSIKYGDTELYSVAAGTNNFNSITLGDIRDTFNNAAENAGLDIRMVITEDGDEITDGDGNNVTQNTLDGAENLKSTGTGIYFVGKAGEDLSEKLTITTNGTTFGGSTSTEVSRIQTAGEAAEEETATDSSKSMTFHVGGEADFYFDINIKEMTVNSLFGYASNKDFANLFMDKTTARDAVGMIDTAIQTALNEQTKLGAMESRLGYTSDNILTMNENLEAADSAYRDADMAKEMTNYMKYAVLSKASQYMLSQAGQNAYQVLNLLNA